MRSKMFALALMCMLATTSAVAQASRTWVSGVGDDANPCSRTAPCKTFAGAISKTAAGGEIDALDPAGFGAVTITKAITIDGGGGQVASILVAGTNAINVSAGTNDVVILRNLRLQGLSQSASSPGLIGINYISGGTLVVENCDIMNFSTAGILQGTGHMIVRNSTATNAYVGIRVNAGTAAIEDTNLSANAYGLYVSGGKVTAVRTVAAQNSSMGFGTGGGELNLADSSAMNNGIGVDSGGIIRISNVTITDNATGIVHPASGQVISWGNNYVAGNGSSSAPTSMIAPQ